MLNNVVLMGRLVATPELKSTQSGTSVTSFTLAVERNYCKTGEDRQTDFIKCVAWRNTAEFITRYFQKGAMIAVTGEIQTRNYEDKDSNKRTATEVVVNQVSFCGSKSESGSNSTSQSGVSSANVNVAPDESDFEEIPDNDDLPF